MRLLRGVASAESVNIPPEMIAAAVISARSGFPKRAPISFRLAANSRDGANGVTRYERGPPVRVIGSESRIERSSSEVVSVVMSSRRRR